MFTSTVLLTSQDKKVQGSSQENQVSRSRRSQRKVKEKFKQVNRIKKIEKMSTVNQDEIRTIKVLKFTGKESKWDHWSEKFVALARARGFAGILLDTERAPRADEEIDRTNAEDRYELTDEERKERKRLRQANGNAYINLELSCEELPYDLVSLAKTEELPDGCARDTWEKLTSEYYLTEGGDKITLLTMLK